MAITVKQIKEWPIGYTSGGYQLFIKTVKKKWQTKDLWYQRVMFTDGTDEILGEINLGPIVSTLFRSMPIRIIVSEKVERDVNNKNVDALYVHEWRDDRPKISEPDELDDLESWRQAREKEIEGKIRHGISCAYIKSSTDVYLEPMPDLKEVINSWVDFIMTGE